MRILFTSFFILCFTHYTNSEGLRYNWWTSPASVRKFFVELGSHEVMKAQTRQYSVNHIRHEYEDSPHFEMGYMLGEIVERYRKLVDIVRENSQYTDMLHMYLHRLMLSQSIFLEMYHLTDMLHEIPRKYEMEPEFVDIFNTSKLPDNPDGDPDDDDAYDNLANDLDQKLNDMKDDYDKRVQERKDKVNKDRETIKRVNDKVVDIYHEIVDKYGPVDKWPPEVIDKFPGGKEVADLIAELERNKEKFGPHAVQPPRTKPPKDFWKKFLKGDWDYGWELEKKWLIGKAIGATNPKIDTKNKS